MSFRHESPNQTASFSSIPVRSPAAGLLTFATCRRCLPQFPPYFFDRCCRPRRFTFWTLRNRRRRPRFGNWVAMIKFGHLGILLSQIFKLTFALQTSTFRVLQLMPASKQDFWDVAVSSVDSFSRPFSDFFADIRLVRSFIVTEQKRKEGRREGRAHMEDGQK